jgi:hypothetical protein
MAVGGIVFFAGRAASNWWFSHIGVGGVGKGACVVGGSTTAKSIVGHVCGSFNSLSRYPSSLTSPSALHHLVIIQKYSDANLSSTKIFEGDDH